jgi:hypothetical protein
MGSSGEGGTANIYVTLMTSCTGLHYHSVLFRELKGSTLLPA